MIDFTGKIATVSGAGSGLGRAISLKLAELGASVLVTDINLDAAQETAETIIQAGGTASALQADTSNYDDHVKVVETAVKEYGALHLAVNNAGITGPTGKIE
ncbi:MAG: SDR family NAD(P)-dependent oxidoreductase, partial [Rothia sp. (in: high G+C Gram-positive bacteria)]|nr:SDR family NAD(P)-dependent oxidoreductase [Rothia sp. (in: high G+C Gram-positive bacteria)]